VRSAIALRKPEAGYALGVAGRIQSTRFQPAEGHLTGTADNWLAAAEGGVFELRSGHRHVSEGNDCMPRCGICGQPILRTAASIDGSHHCCPALGRQAEPTPATRAVQRR
jgi:hypothetical protein